jgi:hypothetical protein
MVAHSGAGVHLSVRRNASTGLRAQTADSPASASAPSMYLEQAADERVLASRTSELVHPESIAHS